VFLAADGPRLDRHGAGMFCAAARDLVARPYVILSALSVWSDHQDSEREGCVCSTCRRLS
jgi:hypothetical protein